MPKKIDTAVKERAFRMFADHGQDYSSDTALAEVVAKKVGVGRETARRWLVQADINAGTRAMTFPEEEMPDVAKAAHEVVQEAQDAGVWIFGGGLESQGASVVATDETVTDGPYPETKEVLGGFAVVDVPSREEALEWAAKIAVACRFAQEAREFMFDPTV
jgi:hypothetical protein